MPQTTPERASRWPGMDGEAITYLESKGYKLERDWTWTLPKSGHEPTEKETDAVVYLIEEWDFGPIITDRETAPVQVPPDWAYLPEAEMPLCLTHLIE